MRKFIGVSSSIIFILVLLVGLFIYKNFNHVKIDKSDEALGISNNHIPTLNDSDLRNDIATDNEDKIEEVIEEEDNKEEEEEYEKINEIVNIALFGIDSRDTSGKGRSDSMIIASIDFNRNKIKLSSLMRDMYVPIEGYHNTKLNHSYAYGGPQLAIKTINQNLGTNIRDYVTVDFFSFEKIIDVIGGVKINVEQNEIKTLNSLIDEVAKIKKEKPIHVKEAGEQILNGQQAVAYSRIRKIGNGDFERAERQRRVLSAIIEKGKEELKDVTTLPKLISEILPLVHTSMDFKTILNLGINYLKSDGLELEQERFPIDGYFRHDMSTGVFYLKYDEEATKQHVVDYIFNDIKPTPKH